LALRDPPQSHQVSNYPHSCSSYTAALLTPALPLYSTVRCILDALQEEEDEEAANTFVRHRPSSVKGSSSIFSYSSTSSVNTIASFHPPVSLAPELKRIHTSLLPLLQIGDALGVKISTKNVPKSSDFATRSGISASSVAIQNSARELTVQSGSGRKDAFGPAAATSLEDEAAHALQNCADDISALWTDPIVKDIMMKRHVQLQDMSGLLVVVVPVLLWRVVFHRNRPNANITASWTT